MIHPRGGCGEHGELPKLYERSEFAHACKLGCEGIVIEAAWLDLSLRSLVSVADSQKSESARRHAGG